MMYNLSNKNNIIYFCGIYFNIQILLIKDTVTSFGLSLLYPFGIYLIPAMFRKCALNSKKRKENVFIKSLQYYKLFKFIITLLN